MNGYYQAIVSCLSNEHTGRKFIAAWRLIVVCVIVSGQLAFSMYEKNLNNWWGCLAGMLWGAFVGWSICPIIFIRARQVSTAPWANYWLSKRLPPVDERKKFENLVPMLSDRTICVTWISWFAADFFALVIAGEVFRVKHDSSELLARTLEFAMLGACVIPATSIAALYLCKWRNFKDSESPAEAPVAARKSKVGRSLTSFFTHRYPYITAYMGFVYFCVLSAFLPNGLGTTITGWLIQCMSDANLFKVNDLTGSILMVGAKAIPPRVVGTRGLEVSDLSITHIDVPGLSVVVSLLVAVLLYLCFSPFAVRLCAGFQTLATRLIIHGDDLLEALMETANVRSTKLFFTESHPHLHNIYRIAAWLAFCYAALFALIAFCPAPLGTTINNWLTSCLIDANLIPGYEYGTYVRDHLDVRLFLASLVAAFGAGPVAVMSCSFLPNKRFQSLILSPRGVLCPSGTGGFAVQSPLKLWSDLKSASLQKRGNGAEVVCLSFKAGGTIKLKTSQVEKEKLAELLGAADEYAPKCKFDPQVTQLRTKLCQDLKNVSLTESNKFSSTIFTPHSSNDVLNGKYRVVRKLAGKSLSAVYLARDPEDSHVVIKQFMLPSNVEQCERMDTQFNREYELLRLLQSGSIAQVLETFEQRGAKYLVMEYIRGSDLRSIVQNRGPRTEKVVTKWAREIAQIMLFLHKQNPPILHRDLTPDNLMQDEDGTLKLIDFGAAHQFIEGVTGTLIGKQCYIAPEQLRGSPGVQSDIYSFGCTLYFLLAGKDPAALQQCDLAADQIAVNRHLSQLVKKCTAFDQKDRFASFEQVHAALESISSYKISIKSRELADGFCRA
jgi:hypothetical protein